MTATKPETADRRLALGSAGGALWALSPVAWLIGDVTAVDRATAFFAALLACFVVVLVVGPALIAVAATAVRAVLGGGRAPATGAALTAVGLAAVSIGGAVELASVAAVGEVSVVGYVIFYLGFLTAFVGALLIGVVVLRRRRDPAARAGGWLLTLAIPLGVGLGALFALLLPGNEAGFAAAVSVPTGTAWVLLGRALGRRAATGAAGQPVPREREVPPGARVR